MNGLLIPFDTSRGLYQIAPGVWGDGSSGRDPCLGVLAYVFCTRFCTFLAPGCSSQPCPSKIEGKVTRTGQFWLQIWNLRQNWGLGSPKSNAWLNFDFSPISAWAAFLCWGRKIDEKRKFANRIGVRLPRPQFWRRFRIWSQNWPVLVTLPSILLGQAQNCSFFGFFLRWA